MLQLAGVPEHGAPESGPSNIENVAVYVPATSAKSSVHANPDVGEFVHPALVGVRPAATSSASAAGVGFTGVKAMTIDWDAGETYAGLREVDVDVVDVVDVGTTMRRVAAVELPLEPDDEGDPEAAVRKLRPGDKDVLDPPQLATAIAQMRKAAGVTGVNFIVSPISARARYLGEVC